MMFSRKLFDGVGYLDESFWIGNYDDIDFCKRAKEQWFKIGLLQGWFVYHFCHATFKDLWIDINSLLGFNKKIFDKKWS
jgi:GT2 family glycosyltransferase